MKRTDRTKRETAGKPKRPLAQVMAPDRAGEVHRGKDEKLLPREEQYRTVFENTGTATVLIEEDTVISLANREFEKLSGYSKQEIEGKKRWTEFVAEEDREFMRVLHQQRRENGEPAPNHYDFRFIDRHQQCHDIHLTVDIVPGTKRSVASLLDVTEARQAERAVMEGREQYRLLFDSSMDAILLTAPNGEIYSANPAACKMFGKTEEEIRFGGRSGIIDINDPRLAAALDERRRTGRYRGELTCLRKDGSTFPAEVSSVIFKDPEGRDRTSMIIRDIAERRRAEEALRASEALFSTIFNTSPVAIVIRRIKDNHLLNVNDAWQKLTGYAKEDVIGRSLLDLNLLSDPAEQERLIGMVGADGVFRGSELRLRRKSGDIANLIMSGVSINVAGEACVLTMATDITKWKLAEEALRKSDRKYRTLVDSMNEGIIQAENDDRILFVNNRFCEMSGYACEELIGKIGYDVYTTEEGRELIKEKDRLRQEGISDIYEIPLKKKNGELIWIRVSGTPIVDEHNNVVGSMGVFSDITEKRAAEEALRDSEERYRLIANNVGDVIWKFDVDAGRFTYMSSAVERLLGMTVKEALSTPLEQILAPDAYQIISDSFLKRIAAFEAGDESVRIHTQEIEQRHKNGTLVPTELVTTLVANDDRRVYEVVGITHNIAERKRAEAQINRGFERLRESLGATIQAMSMIVEARDPYTAGHQRRVADLAAAIAAEMGLSADQINGIRMASAIHDVGKISIPAEILSRPTKLTPVEFRMIQIHPQAGYGILKDIDFPWPIARIVLEHHERINGSGYPNGLTGEKLLIESRIVAVADTVEAMASHRPYRPAVGVAGALEEIALNKGVLFDPDVVEACLKLFREKGYTLPD
jgi:PAS domain S-box-containing protein